MCQLCSLKALTLDKKPAGPKEDFRRSRRVEGKYARQLRDIAHHIDQLSKGVYSAEEPSSAARLEGLLRRYADTLTPWAESVATKMVAEVAARDLAQWGAVARRIGGQLRREIENAPVGALLRARMAEQVTLIKSLPLDAAERVHKLTLEGITRGTRAAEIAKQIEQTGEVSKSRAMLIARTEVSRTATELTKARAEQIGSTHFIWHTVGDSDVRESHRKLNHQVFRWDDPPESDPGHKALPGGIWKCRCWAEPVIPE